MTDYTPILNMPQVAPNQNQKETTINTGLAILEAASNDVEQVDLSQGAVSLTTDQFTKNFLHRLTGAVGSVVVTIPNTPRYFAVRNETSFPVSLMISGGAGSTATLTLAVNALVLVMSDGTNLRTLSSGVSRLQDLSDVANSADASAGQVLGYDPSSQVWGPVDLPADVSFYAPTLGAAQVVLRHIFARSAIYYADFTQSVASATTAASAAATFNVYKNSTLVGTISFASAATTATFSTNTGSGSQSVALAPGDVLSIHAPATADANLAGVALTLKGVYA